MTERSKWEEEPGMDGSPLASQLLGRLRSEGSPLKASLSKDFKRPHLNQYLGAVSCPCHLKLHGKLRSGGFQFQARPGKKVLETPSQWKKKLGVHLSSQ
jgi:hypothetical protein